MKSLFGDCYEGLNVLITGDTGFKGAWLAIWLNELGAKVSGFSLPPLTQPNLYTLSHLDERIHHVEGDLRDLNLLQKTIAETRPTIIFHLAAQAIVLHSYEHPVDTYSSNVMGTIHLMEAVRACPDVKAVVVVTTDKCYENRDWHWGYRENDVLGGHDPYSSSKAMAELAVKAYRHSFFQTSNSPALATARAGNVIGGGDFSANRIIPDAMKALMARQPIQVRNPASIRPWMHVLDPLSGYLSLGAQLLLHGHKYADAWNFGPLEQRGIAVQDLVEKAINLWGEGDWIDASNRDAPPEKNMLRLNWDKAAHDLAWKPSYTWEESLKETVDWFKAYTLHRKDPHLIDLYGICVQHIEQFSSKVPETHYAV
ncbi:MAG: CDP-glucose 4,6-dehydratase [Parachlamydia sp.]|nr:CDP-glucose 4,6-dehydratase [Parachlamydia sp.]